MCFDMSWFVGLKLVSGHLWGKTRVAGKSWKSWRLKTSDMPVERWRFLALDSRSQQRLHPDHPGCDWHFLVKIHTKGILTSNWNSKQHVFFNGCFSWMIPSHYIKHSCFTKHPLKHGCLGPQVLPLYFKKSSDVMKGMLVYIYIYILDA